MKSALNLFIDSGNHSHPSRSKQGIAKMRYFVLAAIAFFACEISFAQDESPYNYNRYLESIENGDFGKLTQQLEMLDSNSHNTDFSENQITVINAVRHYVSGDSDVALRLLESLRIETESPAISCLFARCLAASGKVDRAIEYLMALEKIDRSSAILATLAGLYLSKKKYEKAETTASNALEVDGTSADAMYFRGLARWKLGKTKLAIRDFEIAHSIRQCGPYRNEATPYLLSGTYYATLKQFDKATEAFETAVKIDHKSEQACFCLWKIYSESGKHSDALRFARRLHDLNPDSILAISANARTLMHLSLISDATPFVQKWLEKVPHDPIGNQLMAHIYSYRGEAVSAFESATLSRQSAPLERAARSTYVKMGVRLVRSGKIDEQKMGKSELQNELCGIVEQLCIETNWNRQSYVELAIATFDAFELEQDVKRIQSKIVRTTNIEFQQLEKKR